MKKKCDICKKKEEKEEPFVRIFRETIKTYYPKKDSHLSKTVYRTKECFLCPECYLVKVKRRKLREYKQAGEKKE